MSWKLGIDTGGTFTDCVLVDEHGNFSLRKEPSAAKNPKQVFTSVLESLSEQRGMTKEQLLGHVSLILHGATIAVNALLQMKVAKTGLICTKGFRDILEFREGRKESNDYFLPLPPLIIPRHLRLGVEERMGPDGKEITPLNTPDVIEVIRKFRESGIESIAVCLLHSYLNPLHEEQIREIITREFPEVYLSISHDVIPQIGEYERTSTTVINASLGPIMIKYINEFESLLRSFGYQGEIRYMQANAGVASGEALCRLPVMAINSGPAGGLIAGAFYGKLVEKENVVTTDLGGTSFDTCLIRGGKTDIVTDTHYNRLRISVPMVNINSIGAGGGSIAWLDTGGLLRVGPQSAEANPGPACYNGGNAEPCVTDAHVALGHYNPDHLLGGRLRIDKNKSIEAIQNKIATPLSIDMAQAALGILRVTNTDMADAIRVISLERGYDIRDFLMVSAGGGGPADAAMLAEELSINTIMVPKLASFFCAFGALVSDIRHDYINTFTSPLRDADLHKINQIYEKMELDARQDLEREGISPSESHFERLLDMRYEGEVEDCMVSIPTFRINEQRVQEITDCLHKAHEKLYTFRDEKAVPVISNIRLTAFGPQSKINIIENPFVGKDPSKAKIGTRKAMFNETQGFIDCPIYKGEYISTGNIILGPSIVEEETTTIVVYPKWQLELDGRGFYLMTQR